MDADVLDYVEKIGQLKTMIERLTAALKWQPFATAPKDGRWIIARCNDHSALFYISWGRDQNGELSWCSAFASYGDGLFEPRGDWIDAPQPDANEQSPSGEKSK